MMWFRGLVMQSLVKFFVRKQLIIVVFIAFFMLLTRGSHTLTPFELPDASLALFLLGGLLLGQTNAQRAAWFAVFFILATVIDFGAAAFEPTQGFCLTNGYWGLIPSYGVMWLGGLLLSRQADAFDALKYATVSMVATFIAFVVSTQTYYLFSGRFPANGIIESMQHGWEYLPSWMGFSAMYFVFIWAAVMLSRNLKLLASAKV